jgi:hypothetical protein
MARTTNGLKVDIPYPDSCGAAVLARQGRWISAEGECVPNGKPLPLDALSFLK